MPDNGHITAFDKAHYDQLITYLKTVDDSLNTDPAILGPTADLKLDATLNGRLRPGSPNWDVAKNFATQAGTFGTSAHTRYTELEVDVRTFTKALKDAEDVFQNTGDLATYDASTFSQNYPGIDGTSV